MKTVRKVIFFVNEWKMRERAKGEEKKLLHFVVAVEKILGKHSLVGFQFEDSREFLKVTNAITVVITVEFSTG